MINRIFRCYVLFLDSTNFFENVLRVVMMYCVTILPNTINNFFIVVDEYRITKENRISFCYGADRLHRSTAHKKQTNGQDKECTQTPCES